MTEHVELRRSLGSYLVGALDPVERAEVEAHLSACGSCREELASYAGLPGLMSRVTREEVVSEALLPAIGPAHVAFTAAAGQVASGDLAVADKPWGTALHLQVRLPDVPSYVAWAVDGAGHRTVAASWGRTASGHMDVDGATALHDRSLTSVVVTTGTGVPLLTVQRT